MGEDATVEGASAGRAETDMDENADQTAASTPAPPAAPVESVPEAVVETPPAVEQAQSAEQGEVGAPSAAARAAREVTGVVTSNKPDKTIIVRVDRRIKHPVYGKIIRRRTKLAAHDEANTCREGDTVIIVETRPVSKTKSWAVRRILERAGA